MSSLEVAVVGVGTMGAQALWQLARRGVRVTGFETWAPGHPRGAAGGETRLFRHFELDDLGYAPIVRRASTLWDELQETTGYPLLERTGALVMGAPEDRQMVTALTTAQQADLPYEVLDETEVVRRHRVFGLDAGDIGLWDPRGGSIRPELTVAATAELARSRGAQVRTGVRVQQIDASGARPVVVTDTGREAFDRVVVAAGAWTPTLIPSLAPMLIVRRLTSAWYFGAHAEALRGAVPFLRTEPNYCYGLPVPDGLAMKVGLGFDSHLPVADPDTVPRTLRSDELEPFESMTERYLPGLQRHPMRTDTYLETYTPSRREWIGEPPDSPGVVVLAGFSGHGFKMSPAIGEIAAQLTVDGESDLDVGFLRAGDDLG